MPRKLPAPWTVDHNEDAWWVSDANGIRLSYHHYRDVQLAGTGREKLTSDEARRLAVNFAKLPDAVLTELDPDVRQALHLFMESRSEKLTEGEAVGLLLRDALIGLGDLPLSSANRGRAAGSKGR